MAAYQFVVKQIKNILESVTKSGKKGLMASQVALKPTAPHYQQPVIIPRAQHGISRKHISKNALKVLYRLKSSGYQAYLVGGGVRDLWLGQQPKDFDVATDAHPEDVQKVFRNCRLIGRRFRLAHVHFGQDIIEVATFRGEHDEQAPENLTEKGRIVRDNVYGNLEQDAWRRDFSINALYYNIADFSVVDYTQGCADLKNGVIRLLGDSLQRYREDPVRMVRALRFMAKLDFKLHPDTEKPIHSMLPLLADVPSARLYEEILKLFLTGHSEKSFHLLRQYGAFGQLFSLTDKYLDQSDHFQLIEQILKNTDQRLAQNQRVMPAFFFASLLWPALLDLMAQQQQAGLSFYDSFHHASHDVFNQQVKTVALPKRITVTMREIWQLQFRLVNKKGKSGAHIASHPRFRAAYDFLLLRANFDDSLQEAVDWWQTFYQEAQTNPVAVKTKSSHYLRRGYQKKIIT